MQRIATILAVVLTALHVDGCATISGASGAKVVAIGMTLTASGTILLDGKVVPPDRLVERLKSRGATAETAVIFDIPAGATPSQFTALTSRLLSAGYAKVIFKGPRHAEVSASGASRPLPGATRRPAHP